MYSLQDPVGWGLRTRLCLPAARRWLLKIMRPGMPTLVCSDRSHFDLLAMLWTQGIHAAIVREYPPTHLERSPLPAPKLQRRTIGPPLPPLIAENPYSRHALQRPSRASRRAACHSLPGVKRTCQSDSVKSRIVAFCGSQVFLRSTISMRFWERNGIR